MTLIANTFLLHEDFDVDRRAVQTALAHRDAAQEYVKLATAMKAVAKADFELVPESEEEDSEMSDINTENSAAALDALERKLRRDSFYSKELDRLIDEAIGRGETRVNARRISILALAGRVEKKPEPPLPGAALLDERQGNPREQLRELADAWAAHRGIDFNRALSEMAAVSPELVAALPYGPGKPAPRRDAELSEADRDPRELLAGKASMVARERRIPFDRALEEVKAAEPELVERIAALYRRMQ